MDQSAPPRWPAEPATTLDERARSALLDMGFRQAVIGPVASLAVAGLLCLGLRGVTEGHRLITFLLVSGVMAVQRTVVILGYRRRRAETSTLFWERAFVVSLLLTSLAWGLGAWYVMPAHSPVHQVLIFAFLIGMAGGTAVLYSGFRTGAILTVFIMLVPGVAWMVARNEPTTRILAVASVIFLVLTARGILLLGGLIGRSFRLAEELESARQAAEALARTDDLTGLLNRRAFYEVGTLLYDQAQRHQRPLSILLIDIDRFKQVNDQHGHAAGDSVLRSLASTVRQEARKSDVVGRIGGDEFAVLLPETPTAAARTSAERLRRALSALHLTEGWDQAPITCSMGLAQNEGTASLDELVLHADRALYEAKNQGRDRVAG